MQIVSPEFAAYAKRLYGKDDGQELVTAIHESYDLAVSRLPSFQPPRSFNLSFFTPEPQAAAQAVRGHHLLGSVRVAFSTTAPVSAIIIDIPPTFLHELAHLGHYQRRSPHEEWASGSLFETAFKEGIGRYAELTCVPEWAPSSKYFDRGLLEEFDQVLFRGRALAVSNDLVDLFYGHPKVTPEQLRSGAEPFRFNAYTLGLYIVRKMVECKELGLEDLMNTSFKEAYRFTEENL